MTAFQRLCEQARLPSTNSSMKVKWNACYAIGNATRNSMLFAMNEKEFDWHVGAQAHYALSIEIFPLFCLFIVP